MTTTAFSHEPGTAMECLSIPITLEKEAGLDEHGRQVHDGSAAARAGLRVHDKILQCNGYDFTMVTHKKAVDYIKKHPVLNLLVARKGVTHS
ncbi:PDZ domain-containing protein 1 [Homarus americanus]|uniref:PDZ domain-containing protein 1 n=1 Tax=Homarus americanus TaxID=6706 RepID=A0A8J5JWP6_HOMAM|nr:PDZ domain-containing protein 1 [Homarus americanus]